jgi:membrane-associated protease RseP (regulator of RpoE activity)
MFNVPLLSILGVHEMGHYTAARRHRVRVSPPYFIPFLPIPPLPGTMGALIRLKSPFPDRNALMDIGAAGPLAGAAVAIPVLLAGLALSEVRRATDLLLLSPEIGIRVDPDLRKFVLSRFPFTLIYGVSAQAVRVVAVAHHSRRPGYWRSRRGR